MQIRPIMTQSIHTGCFATRLSGTGRVVAATIMAALVLAWPSAAPAEEGPAPANGKQWEVDSEHIFGFTEGSDIGEKGEKELELEPSAAFGKRGGFYAATSTDLMLKYTVTDSFRVAPLVSFASHNISNVPGLEDRDQFRFQGIGAEIRYRLLNREHDPFGFTLSASPNQSNVDGTTGLPATSYSSEFAALLDKTLIPDRLFAGFNIVYEPEWTRLRATGEWERSSTFGVSGALSAQLFPGLLVAGEVRYMRAYDGIGLNTFLGDALFVGPNLYMQVTKDWLVTIAWNAQVAGRAVGEPGPLDLTNFNRNEVLMRISTGF